MSEIPKKWKVRITESNREVLEQWRIKQPKVDQDPKITCLVSHALNGWLISGRFDGSYMDWGGGYEYKEITFEEFKKYVLMEQPKIEFKPIAMKCNQEQFDAIKPILEKHGMKILMLDSFTSSSYLINNLHSKQGDISNICSSGKTHKNRTCYEEWNQDLFLRCCGIDPDKEIRFKPIAMKCNQEQFDAIKPILEKHGLNIEGVRGGFYLYPFLTNLYYNMELHIGNLYNPDRFRPLVADGEWNQDLFLRCCGIDPTPKFKVGDKVIIKKGSEGYGTDGWRGEFQNIIQTQGYLTIRKEYTREDGTQTVYFEESPYQADSSWLTLYTETKTEMKIYNIKISDLKKIHDVACSSWKTKIKALIVDPFAESIELTQTQVDEMFKAATTEQRPVLVEVFGEPVTQCPYKEGQLLWVWDNIHKYPSARKFIRMKDSRFECAHVGDIGTICWDNAAPFNNGQLPEQFKHLLEGQ